MPFSPMTLKMKQKSMIKALKENLGNVTASCSAVGISRKTHYEWLREHPSYAKACEDIGEIVLDFAEGQLHKQIRQGNTASTIFFLKTKGKERGYIERQEHEVKNTAVAQVQLDKLSPAALEEIKRHLLEAREERIIDITPEPEALPLKSEEDGI